MLMLTRRLQILLDETRHNRLLREAARRQVPVAVLVREAIDAAFPTTTNERCAAAGAILAAAPMEVGDVTELVTELEELRSRRA